MKTQDKHIYISVYLHGKGYVPAGVVLFNEQHGYAGFSYFSSYIENDYPPLNPATLNWRDGNQKFFVVNHEQNKQMLDRTFWEMLPNQNDWGNQILISRYPEYSTMNNAEKLFFLGSRVVGGMSSYVKERNFEENINSIEWLDKIREESVELSMRNIEKISHIKAINPMTSYGGVRPKCMFEDSEGQFWIAKFNLPNDPYDMAIAEHTALQMSTAMGLNTSESKVLTLPSGENVFLSKRFDRDGEKRYHSLSLFALAPGNEAVKRNLFAKGNPASFIQTLIRRYSDFENMDSLNVVTKMILDIGVNNTDNHLRNLRIILNKNHKWELAPIYDVVFNPSSQNHTYNPAGLPLDELYLNNPDIVKALSEELGVKQHLVEERVEIAKKVLNNWEFFCDNNNMTHEDKMKVGNAISLGLNRKELDYNFKGNEISQTNKIQLDNLRPKPKTVNGY